MSFFSDGSASMAGDSGFNAGPADYTRRTSKCERTLKVAAGFKLRLF